MKFYKVLTLSLLLFLTSYTQILAHALWIETNTTGKIGQKQEVKIYFGEYAVDERDSVTKWYSNVKDFTIWIVAPDKQKVQLSTTAAVNYYQTSFTPDNEGVYTLMIAYEAKDLGGTTK